MSRRGYRDRREAGRVLAEHLVGLGIDGHAVVLGLPRGGVPVAAEVARRLGVPLDVLVVRKLGLPGQPELAMGAIASGGVRVLNEDVVRAARVTRPVLDAVTAEEERELKRRERAYRGDARPLDLRDRTVVLVDDGLATGATMRAAMDAAWQHRPRRVLAAVPVSAIETSDAFASEGRELACPLIVDDLGAVGAWYDEFGQTGDDEVRDLLASLRGAVARP